MQMLVSCTLPNQEWNSRILSLEGSAVVCLGLCFCTTRYRQYSYEPSRASVLCDEMSLPLSSLLLLSLCFLQDLANSLRTEIAHDSKRSVSEEACQHLSYVLQLMEKVVRFGQGKLVTNPKQLVQVKLHFTKHRKMFIFLKRV